MSSETEVKTAQWRAVVAIKNPVSTTAYLESCVFTFYLGHCVDEVHAKEIFKRLGFTIPERAYVIYEETK
jgi:hypothetical protein